MKPSKIPFGVVDGALFGDHMGEVNWVVSLTIGLFLSIPISIIANLLTPRIQNWLDKRAVSTRGKRLEQLKREHNHVVALRNDPSLLQLTVSRAIVDALARLFFLVVAFPILSSLLSDQSWGTVILGLFTLFALLFSDRLNDLVRNLTRLIEFDKYDRETAAKIAEFENNARKEANKDGK
jgi:hypothetical protein